MGKQSMGTPSTALSKRTDNKMVRQPHELGFVMLTHSIDCNLVKHQWSDPRYTTTTDLTTSPTV